MNSLQNKIEQKRLYITQFLSTLFLLSAIIAFIQYLLRFAIYKNGTLTSLYKLCWILITLSGLIFAFIRFYLAKRRIAFSFNIIKYTFILLAAFILLTIGTDATMPYLLFIVVILSSSIILNTKQTLITFLSIISLIAIIYSLHTFNIIQYNPSTTESSLLSTFMNIVFLTIIVYIARLSYSQIEHSYQQAFDYAKKLERLNKNLSKIIRLRTKQLEKSFEKQVDSVHNAAVIGQVTQPMIHDLATPLSSVKGACELLGANKLGKESRELVEATERSVQQMVRIIEDARNLMSGQSNVTQFSPYSVIKSILRILKSELHKHNIEVTTSIYPAEKIIGISTIFERIVTNILLNAIEELQATQKKRMISVKGTVEGDFFILSVQDSGRGIRREHLKKLFTPDFSLKKDPEHLGLGLPFVKKIIQKKFGGSITVESQVGKFTRFTLRFRRRYHARKTQKSRKVARQS